VFQGRIKEEEEAHQGAKISGVDRDFSVINWRLFRPPSILNPFLSLIIPGVVAELISAWMF
jgi:hypothetical protein